ncbi:MAG: glycosyltransferase family 2 protein [Cyclobacteriaceae bacterium]|nr:glycosyltransferase family 2 protein [Cyclobacteriaceae bacterium]
MSISCFIAGADATDLQQTISELKSSGLVKEVFVVQPQNPGLHQVGWIEAASFGSTRALEAIAAMAGEDLSLFYTKSMPLHLGQYALERMCRMAIDAQAVMLYADHYTLKNGNLQPHPTIEYQEGSLRDDFDFGSVVVYQTDALKKAVKSMDKTYAFAGLYDLRLRLSQTGKLVRMPEFLYTEAETDIRQSGQKMFDYVDPKNRDVQVEMEQACSGHLKAVGAYLEPVFRSISFDQEAFAVEASVIIPVRNREKTIADAIESVLSQETAFDFNLIVVDNFSTDDTSNIIKSFAANDRRIIHLVPRRSDLGIGGCWNVGVAHPQCGKFAIQLDSDDLYIDRHVISRIVGAFYEQNCAMLVGSYQMVNFDLEEIPPGLIDHKEWTPNNGRNNALRINGLGAPRAFYTPVLRDIKVPNTSYGEDYALGLNISREYQIGRIYEPLYLCRRWDENSDASLDIQKLNAHNFYKDKIRTLELWARRQYVKSGQKL